MLIPNPCARLITNLTSRNGVILYQWGIMRVAYMRERDYHGLPWITMDSCAKNINHQSIKLNPDPLERLPTTDECRQDRRFVVWGLRAHKLFHSSLVLLN